MDCVVDPKVADLSDMRTPMVRVTDPAQSNRCGNIRASTGDQCFYVVVPGAKYCKLHGGTSIANYMAKRAVKLYDLQKYRGRLDRLEGNGLAAASRLTEELGILRMSLESLVGKGDEVEFVSNAPKITQCVREIRETLKVDHQMAKELGELMDKAVMTKICEGMVAVVQKHVPPESIPAVADEIASLLAAHVAALR